MAKNSFYVTTPIYYVNDIPHIGHAYTSIAADVLARYYREKGSEVFFLMGTDEHGAKIAEAAEKAHKKPQEFVDDLAKHFEELWHKLNINYSEFIRTTNPKHEKIVQDIIKKLQKNGYVEKHKYQGWYCVGCEKYLLPNELVDGKCPDHKKEPVLQSEENYFFLLSKASADHDLIGKIERDEIKISPQTRKNEIIGKIKSGLEDVSISRENVEWGIKYPGDETQTVYVWIDALVNYYTATKIYKNAPAWPADLHLMAKDILWFHAIIWPAILLALGEELPKEIFAHGFFTVNGEKMSKSVGNVVDPLKIIEKYGADTLRYSLLREFPFGEDGDISEEKIASRYDGELASGLGNLTSRIISMIEKYKVKIDPEAKNYIEILDFEENIQVKRFDLVLASINFHISETDKLIEESKPWGLAKSGETQKLTTVLSGFHHRLSQIAALILPFMPETAVKMQHQLKTLKPEPLFPRIEK